MLKPHQVKFAKGYSDKALIAHETGTGKTICACVWLHDGRDNDALVIAPKRAIEKWKVELKKWQTKATVVSKEQFKKIHIKKWSAIVVDECDEFASPLFTKGRSQLSESLYNLIKAYDVPIMLASATPIRSNPWNLHTLLLKPQKGEICDHINGNKLDNRRINLRKCNAKENARNKGHSRNNTSGFKGVYWMKDQKKWLASIRVDDIQRHIGVFSSKEEAAIAYKEASLKYHGKFSRTDLLFSND